MRVCRRPIRSAAGSAASETWMLGATTLETRIGARRPGRSLATILQLRRADGGSPASHGRVQDPHPV